MSRWVVCQIGAREHYAVARALHRSSVLDALITDLWFASGRFTSRMIPSRRLQGRFHHELVGAPVRSLNVPMLAHESRLRFTRCAGWNAILARNAAFQRHAGRALCDAPDAAHKLFAYSYAAVNLFRHAKQRGWQCVLGQIDPGPEEERIVAEEHRRYPGVGSSWRPAPQEYWELWRQEIELADCIVVNSKWSRDCLAKEGVPAGKMEIVPLVFEGRGAGSEERGVGGEERRAWSGEHRARSEERLRVLFLGQVNLRKGIVRLIEAMRLLREEPVELTLAGPTQVDPSLWADLPNVRYVGPVPRSEVSHYYREADVFILPTLSDGYALTQLEALTHGLPVVASKHCGEAVTNGVNGVVLENLEPQTIADSLRMQLHHRNRFQVTAPAFSLDQLAQRLTGLALPVS